jgi:hypothetical protein
MNKLVEQIIKVIFSVYFLTTLLACNKEKSEQINGEWIKGTEQEKLNKIEKQLRGFDMAMVEAGYRYQELYWAGQDKNWEYADYQLGKIKVAIENGLERRPKRAKSAEYFLTTILPEMKKLLEKRNSEIFNKGFQTMTINCNSCHSMEKVPFFNVQIPTERKSPIKLNN